MEKVAVEEEDIAGIHLNVDNRKTFKDCRNAFLFGSGLISRQHVVDSSKQMSPLDHLKAAIFASGWIDRYERAAEIGCKDAILIPITVVLMPGPGATGLCIFIIIFEW